LTVERQPGGARPNPHTQKGDKEMNLVKGTLTIAVVLFIVVIGLAMVGPMVVQDGVNGATGNGDTAVDNIKESLDNANDALENGPVGDFFEAIDNG
jgi:hypothetical protein